jgi:hypothetical protein
MHLKYDFNYNLLNSVMALARCQHHGNGLFVLRQDDARYKPLFVGDEISQSVSTGCEFSTSEHDYKHIALKSIDVYEEKPHSKS